MILGINLLPGVYSRVMTGEEFRIEDAQCEVDVLSDRVADEATRSLQCR